VVDLRAIMSPGDRVQQALSAAAAADESARRLRELAGPRGELRPLLLRAADVHERTAGALLRAASLMAAAQDLIGQSVRLAGGPLHGEQRVVHGHAAGGGALALLDPAMKVHHVYDAAGHDGDCRLFRYRGTFAAAA